MGILNCIAKAGLSHAYEREPMGMMHRNWWSLIWWSMVYKIYDGCDGRYSEQGYGLCCLRRIGEGHGENFHVLIRGRVWAFVLHLTLLSSDFWKEMVRMWLLADYTRIRLLEIYSSLALGNNLSKKRNMLIIAICTISWTGVCFVTSAEDRGCETVHLWDLQAKEKKKPVVLDYFTFPRTGKGKLLSLPMPENTGCFTAAPCHEENWVTGCILPVMTWVRVWVWASLF